MKQSSATLRRLGRKLHEQRSIRNVSQERLALATKLSRNYIGSLERGEANPSVLTLEKIARALGTETWKLLQ